MDGTYRKIIVQSYPFSGRGSSSKVRCRPIAGQGWDTNLNVECCKTLRNSYPVGTYFELMGKLSSREGTPFVYTSSNSNYKVLTAEEVRQLRK